MRGTFLGHHPGEAEQPVLRRHVGGLQRRCLVAVHRSHIDQRAGFLRIHVLDAGLGGEEGAVEMDGEHLLPVGEGEFLDRVHDLDAGIGHEDVDSAKRRNCLLDPFIDLVFFGHVHGDADRRFLAAELFSGFRRAGSVQIGDHHASTLADIGLGDAVADAARGTGDESNLAVELHGSALLNA